MRLGLKERRAKRLAQATTTRQSRHSPLPPSPYFPRPQKHFIQELPGFVWSNFASHFLLPQCRVAMRGERGGREREREGGRSKPNCFSSPPKNIGQSTQSLSTFNSNEIVWLAWTANNHQPLPVSKGSDGRQGGRTVNTPAESACPRTGPTYVAPFLKSVRVKEEDGGW